MWLTLAAIRKINSSQEVRGMKSNFLQICVFCALSILSHCINSYDGNPPRYRIFLLPCWNFCQPIFPSLSRSFPIVVSPSSVSPSTPHFLLSTNLSVVHFVPLSKLTKILNNYCLSTPVERYQLLWGMVTISNHLPEGLCSAHHHSLWPTDQSIFHPST